MLLLLCVTDVCRDDASGMGGADADGCEITVPVGVGCACQCCVCPDGLCCDVMGPCCS